MAVSNNSTPNKKQPRKGISKTPLPSRPNTTQKPKRKPKRAPSMDEIAKSPLAKALTNQYRGYRCRVFGPDLKELRVSGEEDFSEQFPKPRLVKVSGYEDIGIINKLIGMPPIAKDEVYLVISNKLRTFGSAEDKIDLSEVEKYAPLVYDVFDESNKVYARKVEEQVPGFRGNLRTIEKYVIFAKSKPPKDFEMIRLREKMVKNFTRAFNMSMIVEFDRTAPRTHGDISIDKTINLLNALGLGYMTFNKDVYKGYTKTRDIAALLRAFEKVQFVAPIEDDENIAAAIDQAKRAEDLLDLWDDMSKEVRFSMRLDRQDLDDAELISKVVKQYAELIDIEPSVDALAAGVPLEDLKIATE